MILPIRAYGDPVLRAVAAPVTESTPELQRLIDSMIETMRGADGAGLAAPQVGRPIRVFVADLTSAARQLPPAQRPELPPQPMVCINPELVAESDEREDFEEGCLSIPNLPVWVRRPERVVLRYLDRDFRPQEIEGFGPLASVLQHERDHLDGVLHVDLASPVRKRLLQRRLRRIAEGDFGAAYPMRIGDGE